jgi:hypothetical protein
LSDAGATSKSATVAKLQALRVSRETGTDPADRTNDCDFFATAHGDYGKCMATDTGDGLFEARKNLTITARQNALRFIILLSDGAVNGSAPDSAKYYDPTNGDYACPKNINTTSLDYDTYTDQYFRECQDGDARLSTYHDSDDPLYDADDYARDQARDIAATGNTIVFTIGLGSEVTFNPLDLTDGCPTDTLDGSGNPSDPLDPGLPMGQFFGYGGIDGTGTSDQRCNADARPNGEQLLRYIADAGDGDSIDYTVTDPCGRVNVGNNKGMYLADISESCGNYFYAASGGELRDLFNTIAEHIFTRITK